MQPAMRELLGRCIVPAIVENMTTEHKEEIMALVREIASLTGLPWDQFLEALGIFLSSIMLANGAIAMTLVKDAENPGFEDAAMLYTSIYQSMVETVQIALDMADAS